MLISGSLDGRVNLAPVFREEMGQPVFLPVVSLFLIDFVYFTGYEQSY